MNIVGLFLVSGEEIVGKLIQEADGNNIGITLMEPFKILLLQAPQGQGFMPALVPLLISNPKGVFVFKKEHVILGPFELVKGMMDLYMQQTTGIQIANNINVVKN